MHTVKKYILAITSFILRPIQQNTPFICMMTIMGATIPFLSFFQSEESIVKDLFWRCSLSSIIRSFSIAYILATLLLCKRLKWLKWPLIVCSGIIGITLSLCYSRYHLPVSPALFAILTNTSLPEIRGFISTLPQWFLIALPFAFLAYIFIYLIIEKKCHFKYFSLTRHSYLSVISASIILIMTAVGLWKFREVFHAWHCTDKTELDDWNYNRLFSWGMPRDIYSAIGLLSAEINIDKRNIESQRLSDTRISAQNTIMPNDSLNIIFVIGESYQPWHAGIYGYQLPTTPKMASEQLSGNLVAFNDAASVVNTTPDAIFNILSLNRIANDETYFTSTFFPQLFTNAGWDTFFCEHQFTPNSIFDNSIYNFVNNQISQNYGWTKYIESHNFPYDADNLYNDWKVIDSFNPKSPHRLTIYHLKGQHFDYNDKYPNTTQFNRFTINDYEWRKEYWLDSKRKQTIAHYDNATLYNDYCMGLLFDRYRNHNAIIIYCSDHAEEIYDYRDFCHREYYNIKDYDKWVDYEIRIPLVVWMSDLFIQKYPQLVNDIKSSVNKVISIDDIGHFILSVGGIETSPYNPTHDFSSSQYIAPERITINNIRIKPINRVQF